MGENFKLRWNDHHSIFFSTAEALCQGDHLTDVTLSCGKREFSAHKLVLSICSTYFNELFTPKPENKNRPANGAAIVYLKDVDAHHMELLLNFMYRGEINVEEEELMDLIATARGLSIRGLSDSDEDATNSNENSSRQIQAPPPRPTPSNNVPKNQPSKAVKRSKSPSQPSTSSAGAASAIVDASAAREFASAAKKIKHESNVVEIAPEPLEGYDDDSGGGEGASAEAEEFANPDAVYDVEDQEDYDLEEGEGEGDGMMYEGDLPHPEHMKMAGMKKPRKNAHQPYACEFCGLSIPKKNKYLEHVMIHTGERQFACNQCNYTCIQKGNLRKHMMRQHGVEVILSSINNYRITSSDREKADYEFNRTQGQTLGCNQCNYTCRQAGNLRKHMQVKHGIEVQQNSISMYRLSFGGGQKSFEQNPRVQGHMEPDETEGTDSTEFPPLHHFLMDNLKTETP